MVLPVTLTLEVVGSSVVEGGVKAMGIVVAVDESEDFGACIGGVEKKMTTKLNLDRCTSSLGVVDAGCLRWLVGGAGRRVVGVP